MNFSWATKFARAASFLNFCRVKQIRSSATHALYFAILWFLRQFPTSPSPWLFIRTWCQTCQKWVGPPFSCPLQFCNLPGRPCSSYNLRMWPSPQCSATRLAHSYAFYHRQLSYCSFLVKLFSKLFSIDLISGSRNNKININIKLPVAYGIRINFHPEPYCPDKFYFNTIIRKFILFYKFKYINI